MKRNASDCGEPMTPEKRLDIAKEKLAVVTAEKLWREAHDTLPIRVIGVFKLKTCSLQKNTIEFLFRYQLANVFKKRFYSHELDFAIAKLFPRISVFESDNHVLPMRVQVAKLNKVL